MVQETGVARCTANTSPGIGPRVGLPPPWTHTPVSLLRFAYHFRSAPGVMRFLNGILEVIERFEY